MLPLQRICRPARVGLGLAAVLCVCLPADGAEFDARGAALGDALALPTDTSGLDAFSVAVLSSSLEDLTVRLPAARNAEHVASMALRWTAIEGQMPPPLFEIVLEGEDFEGFLARTDLSSDALLAANPGLEPETVVAGQSLAVGLYDGTFPARSLGTPNRGSLVDGLRLPPDDQWVIDSPDRAYGSSHTIEGLILAIRAVNEAHPDTPALHIFDLSSSGGGRARPHRSHQSGRDVDLGYYRESGESTYERTRARDLDCPRTWTFVRSLLTESDITYIFMARDLQVALFDYAESQGEDREWLESIFERGPGGHRNPRAVIRFARGHDDHMHVRFACSELDYDCGEAH